MCSVTRVPCVTHARHAPNDQCHYEPEFGSGGEGGGACFDANRSELFLATTGRFLLSVAMVVVLTTWPCLIVPLSVLALLVSFNEFAVFFIPLSIMV